MYVCMYVYLISADVESECSIEEQERVYQKLFYQLKI